MSEIEKQRLLRTFTECRILNLSPDGQSQLADKLIGEGFTAISVATLWREACQSCDDTKSATKTVVALLRKDAETIRKALGNCRADMAPGEVNWRHKQEEPIDHERASRMAYCRVVCDLVNKEIVAEELNVGVGELDAMIALGRELQTTIIKPGTKTKAEHEQIEKDARERMANHREAVLKFRQSMNGDKP